MIDVIIPVYNSHVFLSSTLECLINQTIISKLIITIIDDGSNKNYSSILEKYQKKANINVITLIKNHGPGYARNIGIKKTNQEYLFFMDSDDLLSSSKSLEVLYQKAISNSSLQLIVGKEKIDNNISIWENNLHGKLIKREVIKKYKIKFPNYRIAEDTGFIMIIYVLLSENEIIKVNELIYIYNRLNPNSITFNFRKNNYIETDYFKSLDYMYKYVKKYHKFDNFKKKLLIIIEALTIIYFKNYFNQSPNIREGFLSNCHKFYLKYNNYLKNIELTSKYQFSEDINNLVQTFLKIIKTYNK